MSGEAWRILFTGKNTGAVNMAVDAAVLGAVESGQSPPTLRLYRWDPYCVTLGHFQDPRVELDAARLSERGWDFALRPTGGRAVLHAEEITYSVAARRDAASWCGTLAASHRRIAQAWSRALSGFGLRVSDGQDMEKPRRGEVNLPCFASTSRAELAHAGRKVVGSAQRRNREGFLQHGSIPLSPAHEGLVEVLRLSPLEREAHLQALRRHAVSLGEIAALPREEDQWERALARAFCEALEVPGAPGELSAAESAMARELEASHRARQRKFFLEEQGSGRAASVGQGT
jgi:lipoate-protein ligase A